MNFAILPGVLVCLLFVLQSAKGQYVDLLAEIGLEIFDESEIYGSAVSFADFNGDGWDDLSIASNLTPPRFFINDQNGGFNEVELGILEGENKQINMLLWADYDNDGDRDLFISVYNDELLFLKNEGDLQFTDVTQEVGLAGLTKQNYGASFGDINGDGLLDLYLCRYNTENGAGYSNHNRLFKQLPNGVFQDITSSAGVGNGLATSFQSVFWDYNEDGLSDIFIINDRFQFANILYVNSGDETFQALSPEIGLSDLINAMSIAIGDYDLDEDYDVFISNTSDGNLLKRQEEDLSFTNMASPSGLSTFLTCWGAAWLDYDNNGSLDLYVAAAPLVVNAPPQVSQFYSNDGDGTFSKVTNVLGLINDLDDNHAVARGDHNRDGKEDLLIGVNNGLAKLLENRTAIPETNHWLSFNLEGVISNRDAIGARVKTWAGGQCYSRFSTCGDSFISQHSYNLHVGIGSAELIDSLSIIWPSGLNETYYSLQPDSFYHFLEGSSLIDPLELYEDLVVCEGQQVSISLNPGPFESIEWSDGNTSFERLIDEAGAFSAVLTHPSGYTLMTDTFQFSYAEPSIPEFEAVNPSCPDLDDGYIEFIASNNAISSINWINLGESFSLTGLSAGSYYFEGLDEFQCPFAGEISLVSPPPLSFETTTTSASCYGFSDGSAEILIDDLEAEVIWSNGDTALVADSLQAGTYEYLIQYGTGCELSGALEIVSPDLLMLEAISMPSDNPDCTETWQVELEVSGGVEPYSLIWILTDSEGVSSEIDANLEADCIPAAELNISLIDSNNCETNYSLELETITDIHYLRNQNLILYPNPGKGYFRLSKDLTGTPYVIFDRYGRMIHSEIIQSELIDLSFLDSGFYHFHLNDTIGRGISFIIE